MSGRGMLKKTLAAVSKPYHGLPAHAACHSNFKLSGGSARPRWSWYKVMILPLVVCVVLGWFTSAMGQDPAVQASQGVDEQAPVAADEPMVETGDVVEKAPAETLFAQIDGVFAKSVSMMEQVLFYKLGTTQRYYAVYSKIAVFTRDRGSDGDFSRVGAAIPEGVPPEHGSLKPSLTMAEVQMLDVQGELIKGHILEGAQRTFRLGTLNGREVEYVQVKVPHVMEPKDGKLRTVHHGDKFVLDPADAAFHWIEPKHELLSNELVLSAAEVSHLNDRGLLNLPDHAAPGQPPYIHSEAYSGMPLVVAWLSLGALFFTLYMKGFNVWGFTHAINIVRGKYDDPKEKGEVTHFQALSSALSATVGLGNIAGVTIAMTAGGPGAFFWMLMCGIFGMTSKFVECTLGVKYRTVNEQGHVLGGPMRYLKDGLAELKLPWLGAVLSFTFTVMCVLASFGGGNMFQAHEAGAAMLQMVQQGSLDELAALKDEIRKTAASGDAAKVEELQAQRRDKEQKLANFSEQFIIFYGLILAGLVGVVIVGGIKRIGQTAEKIVPFMCLTYAAACLFIIFMHISEVPALIQLIFTEAFTGRAAGGGMLGVLVIGVQRAAFSNEAGTGSAAIAHSAAKTHEPIREGCVALLEPFIDTVVVCSMTALVILITGAWNSDEFLVDKGLKGAALTVEAFRAEISWFPYVLGVAVTLFAYSTIISWSYYGERCWEILFGQKSIFVYRILTLIGVFIGTIVNLGSVLDFSTIMVLAMAFPNIAGLILLSPSVRKDLMDYWKRYQAGEFKVQH